MLLRLPVFRRLFHTTNTSRIKKIKETTQGAVTTIELENVPEPSNTRYFEPNVKRESVKPIENEYKETPCTCALCKIPVRISYGDVLILEQFMRQDGTVLPNALTGVCDKQQHRLERCVMQAHWSGLFPDRTIPEFDQSGYKRFNRHWDDDMSMYRLKFKMEPGSWFYIKRYNPWDGKNPRGKIDQSNK